MARKKRYVEPENRDRWMVSYADFVTLLFAFFVSLYALSNVNETKYKKLSESLSSAFRPASQHSVKAPSEFPRIVERFTTVFSPNYRRVLEVLHGLEESDGLTLLYDQDSITIRMADTNLFSPASDELLERAMPILAEVASVLKGIDQHVRIEGHTDNIPVNTASFPSNWDLSTARSLRVLKYFINNHGLAPGRFSAVGYGEFSPIETNNTPGGRMKNSRVDIMVLTPQ
jgi:chemotaxis protein MotB